MFVPLRFFSSQLASVHSQRFCLFSLFAVTTLGGIAAESGPITAADFHQRSEGASKTLFTTLSPDETGLKAENRYDDPTMWWENYREFSLGAIGTGVAIGDYDSDGLPDVFVVSKTAGNRLFRNLGGFRFEDVTARAGVGGSANVWSQGAAFADVNNDGLLDLYVCRCRANNLLFINQGDGTFKEEAVARGLGLADASGMGAFCDYDRDGWLDVYVQTNLMDGERRPNGQRDRLYRNNRDGTFTDVSDRAGIVGETQGHSATWWDYNEDGWPDLYVANDFKDPDQLYRNNGDGTFTNVLSWVVPHTPHSSMGADFGDVNNDGHIDLLVADMAATTRIKDQRGMAKLRVGLTENEQRPDAAPQYMRNALYLNTGAGVMLEGAFLAGLSATDWTWTVRLEDLDNDGKVDAYFTNGMVRELHNADIVQKMSGKESLGDRVRIMKASPPLIEQNLAFRNRGDLSFENVSAAWGLDHAVLGSGAAFGDLDGDGDLDLVFASIDGTLTTCRNDGATGNSIVVALKGTTSNRFGVGATVKIETAAGVQVRALTPARGYLSTSEPVLHFGLGDLSEVTRLTVEWPSGIRQAFDGLKTGRRYTITEPSTGASPGPASSAAPPGQFVEMSQAAHLNVQNREKPFNELSAQPLLPFRQNRVGPAVAFSDFDGDGEDDLAIGGVAGEKGQLFSNLGGGQFLAYGGGLFAENSVVSDGPLLAFDADADGDMDLLITKAGVAAPADSAAFQPRLLLNDRTGTFTPAPADTLPPLPFSVGAVAAADFEHSGRLALFVGARLVPGRYPEASQSALLVWRDGRYVDATARICPELGRRGMVTAALWSDVDDDGWLDLLVTYDWGYVACYRNVEGRSLEDVTAALGFAAAGKGWWRSIASGDFNEDGRPDFVVGNVGLNTPYHGSSAEPATLYSNVTLAGSAPQLVEAHAENGRWYPMRTRDVLGKVFPALLSRIPTFDAYARATFEEVFPPESLAGATRYTASELRSGVFLSQKGGKFTFVPLPRLAQISPISGVAAVDMDGDGHVDIVAVGNSFAPIPEVGRFDGGVGWLLRGDGSGSFEAKSPADSGIIVRRDAKALAVVDFNRDGWPDFFITRNNDRALAFRNSAVKDRRCFGLTLRGKPGNPAAVGARITVSFSDGHHSMAEIAAGSGYFAQSTSTAFFGHTEASVPTAATIRWPDGSETTQTFSAPPLKIVRISAP